AAARDGWAEQQAREPTPLQQARALREVLVAAVERLRPQAGENPSRDLTRPDAAHYLILRNAYVDGLPTKAIMVRNSISESTFHRYRRDAVSILARELAGQERALAHPTLSHQPPLTQISAN